MKVLYSKYTDYRSKEFQIYTKIIEDSGMRFVTKEAVYPQGVSHVKRIADMYRKLQEAEKSPLFYCPARLEGDVVYFDFIEGNTLKSRILAAVQADDKEQVKSYIQYYCNLLCPASMEMDDFKMTDDFVEWFGTIDGLGNEKAKLVTNLDCNVGNIICRDNKEFVIDYEWVFEFPIPVGFLKFVNLSWLYYFDVPEIRNVLPETEMYALAGLDLQSLDVYRLMEKRHGNRIDVEKETEVNMFSLKDKNLKQPSLNLNQVEYFVKYYTPDGEVDENASCKLDAISKNGKVTFNLPSGTSKAEFKIKGGNACSVKWLYVYGDGKELPYHICNGYVDGAYVFFDAQTPLFDVDIPAGIEQLEVTGHYYFTSDEDLIEVYHRNALMKISNKELEMIKTSKSWRMIKSVTQVVDKIKGE